MTRQRLAGSSGTEVIEQCLYVGVEMGDCLVGWSAVKLYGPPQVRHPAGLGRPDEGVWALRVLLPARPISPRPVRMKLLQFVNIM